MADFHEMLHAVGHSAQSIHPADLERSHTLMAHGADPATALTVATILNALEHGHLSLDEIEGIFGHEVLHNVYSGSARAGVADIAGESDARTGSEHEGGLDEVGEQLRRIGEAGEADEAGGPDESAGPDAAAAKEDATSAEDVPAQATAEGQERLEGVAERLSAIAAELGAIVAELNGEPEDGKIAVRAHFRRVKPAADDT